jgi:hypothetical protein
MSGCWSPSTSRGIYDLTLLNEALTAAGLPEVSG